jgi:hypothetical protein
MKCYKEYRKFWLIFFCFTISFRISANNDCTGFFMPLIKEMKKNASRYPQYARRNPFNVDDIVKDAWKNKISKELKDNKVYSCNDFCMYQTIDDHWYLHLSSKDSFKTRKARRVRDDGMIDLYMNNPGGGGSYTDGLFRKFYFDRADTVKLNFNTKNLSYNGVYLNGDDHIMFVRRDHKLNGSCKEINEKQLQDDLKTATLRLALNGLMSADYDNYNYNLLTENHNVDLIVKDKKLFDIIDINSQNVSVLAVDLKENKRVEISARDLGDKLLISKNKLYDELINIYDKRWSSYFMNGLTFDKKINWNCVVADKFVQNKQRPVADKIYFGFSKVSFIPALKDNDDYKQDDDLTPLFHVKMVKNGRSQNMESIYEDYGPFFIHRKDYEFSGFDFFSWNGATISMDEINNSFVMNNSYRAYNGFHLKNFIIGGKKSFYGINLRAMAFHNLICFQDGDFAQ